MKLAIVKAFKTDYFPLDGNLAEEVLELADGRAVYLNPSDEDQMCDSLEEAFELCSGEPEESESLKGAWLEGYEVK